jgi:NAD(P)-dependent dehydrogenase (short-subunit alcohol dehydrogenase family)
MSFEGRRAIVTGAASGMGRATALLLVSQGARVTAVDVNEAGLADVRDAGCDTIVADLSEPGDRARVVESATADPVNYLVNAAAILGLKPLWDVTPEDFRRIFAINLESAWFLCRDVGRVMVDGGAIVNFSSPSARWAYTLETAPYSATKTALQATTRTFAVALAPRGIRVNAISPGITDTPMQEQVLRDVSKLRGTSYEELSSQRLNLVPLKRSAPAEEMAGFIAFMLSDAAAYMTGQTIYVDGGYIMSA